jgi:urease accessory protein
MRYPRIHRITGEPMHLRLLSRPALSIAALLAVTAPASAHHVMGGRIPASFTEGLLSGLGHPIIGPDHLAFLVAVGIAVGAGGLSLALPLVFVAAMAAGVAVHVAAVNLPAVEFIIALSVLLAGFLLARGRPLPLAAWSALFAVAGFFHGYAYGESIFGAEPSPLAAYLLGLAAIQAALMVAIALVARRLGAELRGMAPRLAGAAILGVGFTVLIGQLVPGA